MAKVLADAVLNAALNYISTNTNKVQLLTSASASILKHTSSGSDIVFSSPGDASGGGRKITVFSGGLSSIAVSTGGTADKLRLLTSASATIVETSTASSYALGSSDSVNFQAFSITIADPT